MPAPAPLLDRLGLRAALAFIWLATGLGVLHPYYREVGTAELARIHLPPWVMLVTCIGEVLLGLRVALGPAVGWLTLLQTGLIVGFTVILAVSDPLLLFHPFGILGKNLPLLALVVGLWLLEREGWTGRTVWVLRVGMAAVWLTEGLLGNLLSPFEVQRRILEQSLPLPIDSTLAIRLAGILQIASFFLALLSWGWPLRLLLALYALGLVVICVVVTRHDALLWFHPFGPLTKNVSILLGTLVLLKHFSSTDHGTALP